VLALWRAHAYTHDAMHARSGATGGADASFPAVFALLAVFASGYLLHTVTICTWTQPAHVAMCLDHSQRT
jgi:hypothetical protein